MHSESLNKTKGAHFKKQAPTIVIKVGTSSLIRPELNCLNLTSLTGIIEVIRDLKLEGYNVVLVSSGAVGVGCQRLGLVNRPTELAKKQALAAVGQVHLMRYYDDLFNALGLRCAQVLVTLDNLANRGQYINAAHTFEELLQYGVIPVVNENDTVAVEQLRIGDNDTLSAHVATLVRADWLFLLTDVDALYTANPSTDPNAKPIREVLDLWKLQVDTSTKGTQWGTGGMGTKITAARIATAGGCNVVITHFARPGNVLSVLRGDGVGTVFHAAAEPVLKGHKRWVLSVPVNGELRLDSGAVRAVKEKRASLFSAGIVWVDGDFEAQDAVRICDDEGREFARGLVNYSREEVESFKGMRSAEVLKIVGRTGGSEEICHRANICILATGQATGREQSESEIDSEDEDSGLPTPSNLSRSETPAPLGFGGNSGGVGEAEEIANRLAALQARAEELILADGDKDWSAEALKVADAERQQMAAGAAAAAARGGAGKEDINEEGWLPK